MAAIEPEIESGNMILLAWQRLIVRNSFFFCARSAGGAHVAMMSMPRHNVNCCPFAAILRPKSSLFFYTRSSRQHVPLVCLLSDL